ncbi:MAG: hypothetical protein SFY80_13650 [Verrucomicrobiota bacterium]|nr:hypothetical protein [Verrucomicrobiota bacterium]
MKYIIICFLFIFNLTGCSTSNIKSAYFISADSTNIMLPSGSKSISKDYVDEIPPLYIIKNDDLYLLLHYTVNNGLDTSVYYTEWNEILIHTIADNMDVKRLLPDPSEELGGIKWIRHIMPGNQNSSQ